MTRNQMDRGPSRAAARCPQPSLWKILTRLSSPRAADGDRPRSACLWVSRASRLAAALVLPALLVSLHWSSMLLAAEQHVVDPNALPKFPPVAARDALNTFQLRKGFRLELVAAEPLVSDPI